MKIKPKFTTGLKRLLRLADHLDTVKKKTFDMCVWRYDTECGAVACAVGHACTIPEFKRAGLSIRQNRYGEWYPSYRGKKVVMSVCAFFGLTENEEMYLFANAEDDYDTTPKQVAKRIRRFVKAKSLGLPGVLAGYPVTIS